MTLRAGAGRAQISLLPDGLPLNGFGTVHDPLYARALVLEDDAIRTVLVLVDLTSLPPELIAELKSVAGQLSGVAPDAVMVVASHTFSAPHVVPEPQVPAGELAAHAALIQAIKDAVCGCVGEALASLCPARLRAGRGRCAIGVNRDVETADGWWLGADDAGVNDPELPVLVFEDLAGTRLAVLATVAVQSSITNGSVGPGGSRAVSGDLAGAAARYLEERSAGCVALVMTGAAGDQAPICTAVRLVQTPGAGQVIRDSHETGWALVDLLGDRLGAALSRAADSALTVPAVPLALQRHSVSLDAQIIPRDIGDIRPTRSYEFVPDGTTEAPWVTLRLGEVVLVGIQPELSAATGIDLRTASPYPHTLLATMVDGGAKYMPEESAYDRITYEAMNSRYARGSAERFAKAIVANLADAHERREAVKISSRAHGALFNLILSVIMSLVMSLVQTAINVGFGPHFLLAFLRSFAISVVVSFVVISLALPVVARWLNSRYVVE